MTIGYPDWERRAAQTGIPSVSISQVITTVFQSASFFVGSFGLLDIVADATSLTDYYLVTVQFWDTAVQTNMLYSYGFTTVIGTRNGIQVPAPGQYVSFQITPAAGTDTAAFRLSARSTNMRHPNPWQSISPAPALSVNVSVPATTVHTNLIGLFIPGQNIVTIDSPTNTSWHVFIERFLVSTNTWGTWWQWDSNGSSAPFISPIMMPAAPLRFNFSNDNTAAKTAIYSVVPVVQ